MLLMMLEATSAEPAFGAGTLDELARLGITTVSFHRDERMAGVVLDGWAFDPTRSAEAARVAIAGVDAQPKVLHPVFRIAVPAAAHEGGNR